MAKKPSLPWTLEENKEFENCIARYGNLDLSNLLDNLGRHFNGKRTYDDVIDHYFALLNDVSLIENGLVPLPDYNGPNDPFVSSVSGAGCRNLVESSSVLAFGGVDDQASISGSANVGGCNTSGFQWAINGPNDPFVPTSLSPVSVPGYCAPVGDQDSSELVFGGVNDQGSTSPIANGGGCNTINHCPKWTRDDHKLFVIGLWKFGKGKWNSIAKHSVGSKTATQVASHAQKYFKRLETAQEKRTKTSSSRILDITVVDDKSLSDLVRKKLLSVADAKAYALHKQGNASPVPETDSSERILNPDSDTLREVNSCVNETTTQNPQQDVSHLTEEVYFQPTTPQIYHMSQPDEFQVSQNVVEPGNTTQPELSLDGFDFQRQELEHISSAGVLPRSPEPSRQARYVHSDSQHLRQVFHVQQEIIDHQRETVSSQRILNPESDTLRGVTSCVNQTIIQNPQMQISYPTCEHHFQPRAPQICHIRPEIQDSQNVVEPAGNTTEPELSLEFFDFEIQEGEHIPFAEVLPHSPDQLSPFVHSDSQHSRHDFHVQQEIIDRQPSWQHFYSQLQQDLQQETRNSPTDSDAQSPQLPSMIIHEISSEDDDDDQDLPLLEPDTAIHSHPQQETQNSQTVADAEPQHSTKGDCHDKLCSFDQDLPRLEPQIPTTNHYEEDSDFDFEAEVSKYVSKQYVIL